MSDFVSILVAFLSFVAATASAIAAFKACAISRAAHDWQRRQVGPNIQVTVRTNADTPTIIYLVIENIGKATAYDIRFELSDSLPQAAFFLTVDEAKQRGVEQMDSGPLFTGIPALASGDSRVFMWGQYGGLVHFLGDRFVKVIAHYRDEQREILESTSVIEVKSFEGTDASDNNPLRAISKHTEKIADALRHASSGHRPLVVETPDSKRTRHLERLEAARQRKQDANANHA